MMGNVLCDVGGTYFLGGEWRMLLVERADFDALFVVEHRAVDRAGDVVFGELVRGAHIDDVVEKSVVFELFYLGDAMSHGAHFNSGSRPFQTLSSKRGCASAMGCMLSA